MSNQSNTLNSPALVSLCPKFESAFSVSLTSKSASSMISHYRQVCRLFVNQTQIIYPRVDINLDENENEKSAAFPHLARCLTKTHDTSFVVSPGRIQKVWPILSRIV